MKGRHHSYTDEELAWIEERKDWPRPALHQAFTVLFDRREVTQDALKQLCLRKGWKTGRTGCFSTGIRPWNTGLHFTPPGSEKGWFKKGQLPHNTKWLGHERVSKDGYVEISVAETNPHTGYERRYVLKHVREWEAANGPIPDGHCLKCLDGNKTNTDPSNWQLIERAILPTLNGGRHKRRPAIDEIEPELRPTLIALATTRHRARQLRKRA